MAAPPSEPTFEGSESSWGDNLSDAGSWQHLNSKDRDFKLFPTTGADIDEDELPAPRPWGVPTADPSGTPASAGNEEVAPGADVLSNSPADQGGHVVDLCAVVSQSPAGKIYEALDKCARVSLHPRTAFCF